MKRFIFLQAIICSLSFCHVFAQDEHWDTYMAKFGDKPGSVLVDMAQIEYAPDKHLQYLVITGPQAQNCDKHGFPDKDEINDLEKILDVTGNFLAGVTAKKLVGTFTYNCERLNYYYVKDTFGVRNAIMRLYKRNFNNYRYAINIKYDPEWTTYTNFLYPDEQTRDWMTNTRIITAMMQQGDSLTKQRDINFDFYFRSDTDRSSFAAIAKIKGYKTKEVAASAAQNATASYELIVSKFGFVKADAIQAVIQDLKKEARLHHGLYNGWDAKK